MIVPRLGGRSFSPGPRVAMAHDFHQLNELNEPNELHGPRRPHEPQATFYMPPKELT
jgi:hypothetical protein